MATFTENDNTEAVDSVFSVSSASRFSSKFGRESRYIFTRQGYGLFLPLVFFGTSFVMKAHGVSKNAYSF